MSSQEQSGGPVMAFGDHLEELRRRLLFALAPIIPVFVLLFLGWQLVMTFLVGPAFEVLASSGTNAGLQLLGPAEAVMAALKLSTIGAIVVGAPWILLQFWLFIAPGLYARERRFIHLVIPLSALLTITGTIFLHRIMLPLLFELMLGFGSSLTVDLPDHHAELRALFVASETVEVRTAPPLTLMEGQAWVEAPQMEAWVAQANAAGQVQAFRVPPQPAGQLQNGWSMQKTVDFTLLLLGGVSIAFQLPVLILVSGWLGLVDPTTLRRGRRLALGLSTVLAAVLTPPDVFSLLLLLVPLYLLYELSIILLVLLPSGRVAQGTLRIGPRGFRTPKPFRPEQGDGVSRSDPEDDAS